MCCLPGNCRRYSIIKKLHIGNVYNVLTMFSEMATKGNMRLRFASRQYGVVVFVQKLVVLPPYICHCSTVYKVIGKQTTTE